MEKEETGQSNEELNLLRRRVVELEQVEAKSEQIEEKLRLERDFNATFIQATPLFFVAIAADGRTLMMNESMLQSLGYTADEVVDRDYLTTFVPKKDHVALSQIFETLTIPHEQTLNENHVLTKDGRELLVEWHGRPVFKEDGEFDFFFGAGVDITEAKRTEERMEHLALVLRAIRNVNQLIVHEKDRDTLIQRACDLLIEARSYYNAWIALFDESSVLVTTAQAGLGKKFTSLIEKLERGELTACGQRALAQLGVVATEDPLSACSDCPLTGSYAGRGAMTVRLEYGGKVYGIMSASVPAHFTRDKEEQSLFNEVAGDIAFALHDIEVEEKRVQAEVALRQSELLLASVFDSIQGGISVLDTDLTIRRTNATIKKWHAANLPLEGKKCYACYQNREIPCDPCPTLRCIQFGKTEHNIMLVEGSPAKWIELFSYPMKDPESGEVKSVVEFVRDITERIRIEQELRKTSERLELAMDAGEHGFWDWNLDTGDVYFSSRYYTMLGYKPGELPMRLETWVNLMHPEDRETIVPQVQQYVENAEPYLVEFRLKCKDGSWKWISGRGKSYEKDDNGVPHRAVGVHVDISERKRAEEEKLALEAQLRQGQKLESIGTLASGVAHEINNPLTGIINYADLIVERVKDDELRKFAQGIMKEGNRVAEIVKNLLSFARQDKQTHSPARMEDIIDASLTLVGAALRKDQITIEKEIPQDLPKVRCRSQQIEQVVINLLTNARDALNQRYKGYDENKVVKIVVEPFEKDGVEWVRTTIEDHGAGIQKDAIDRIFDPFFTTKSRTEGTGLGLSVSHGIIKEHHGELSVESELGEYTRFHIDLRVNNGWSLG